MRPPVESKGPMIQLAPMEGVLDWVLRELLAEVGGFDRMVTEFVRVTDRPIPDHVFYRYCPELLQGGKTKTGVPVFVQLLGSDPEWMAKNAVRAIELGAPGIDLNFGCPAKTVNRHDGGAVLLKQPERVFQVTKAVREALPATIPLTAKVRLGFDHKDFASEIAQAAEEGGGHHLVVHARTKAEMYKPPAHWHCLAPLTRERQIPILANGDIWSVEDYQRCVTASGTERVALGRGVVRRPTLAREIRAQMTGVTDSLEDFRPAQFLRRFFENSESYRGEAYAVTRFKQILRYWSLDDLNYQGWFDQVKRLSSVSEARQFLNEKLNEEEKTWPKSLFTRRTFAPIASVPSNF